MMKAGILKIALAVVVLVILYRLFVMKSSSTVPEHFEDYDPETMNQLEATLSPSVSGQPTMSTAPGIRVPETMAPMSSSVDLLPKPQGAQSEFGEFAPKNLGTQNFIDATKLIGVDTVGSSLRNANYDLRRDPPIKRADTGPWSTSTIESDLYRKSLDC